MALDVKAYFANVPKKQLYIMVGVLVAAALAGYVYFLVMPMLAERDKLQADLQKLQNDLDQKKLIAASRSKLEADIKELRGKLDAALVRLPEEKDIPRLLTQVNTLGQQNGLDFLLFKPGSPTKKGFYAEVPIDMKVDGQYHALGAFLDRIAKLERIVNVSDIKVIPAAAGAQQRADRSIVAELRATTFTFLEKGGTASAPSASSAPAKK
jgi:type IV pilus assembly protein PilO